MARMNEMTRELVSGLKDPNEIATPATLFELLEAFEAGARLCIVVAEANMNTINEQLDAWQEPNAITAFEIKERGLSLFGLPPSGQVLLKHVVVFMYSRERKVDQPGHSTCHMLVCAAPNVQGDAPRELQFCEAVCILALGVRPDATSLVETDADESREVSDERYIALLAVLYQRRQLPGCIARDGVSKTWQTKQVVPVPADYIEGSKAHISGLLSRLDLNGKQCRLIKRCQNAERWAVEVTESGELVQVRPQNLSKFMRPTLTGAPALGPLSERLCSFCAADPGEDRTFKRCKRCIDEQVAIPARYCSTRCQQLAWPDHKSWHRQVMKNKQLRREYTAAHRTESFVSLNFKQPWLQHMSRGNRAMKDGDYNLAAKEYAKSAACAPQEPITHFELG
eukprot:4691968-Prymnesium_polylepis.1